MRYNSVGRKLLTPQISSIILSAIVALSPSLSSHLFSHVIIFGKGGH